MSQKLSVDLTVDPALTEGDAPTQSENSEPVNLLAPSPVALIDSRANDVIDDLFQDLDQALAGKAQLNAEPSAQRAEATAQLATRWSEMGQTPSPLADALEAPDPNQDAALQPASAEPAALSQAKDLSKTAPAQRVALIERLLVIAACLSVAAVAAAWLVLNQMRQQAQQTGASVEATSDNLQAPMDQNFVDYVQRSLDAIDRRTETQRQVASVSGTVAGRGLPSVAVTASPGSPQVTERVYVPLYQPPAIASYGSSLPSLSTAPLPGLAPAAPNPPNIATTGIHVLVGVLELGDRSAALFEVNGTTQRINIGERIGTSGWALVSVSNQEAIVRRNGEVRSVYIGQQF